MILAGCSSVEPDKQIAPGGKEREAGATFLTPESPTLEQLVDQTGRDIELIEVEISEVFNPEKNRIIFEVRYKFGEQETLLGNFGLHPPEAPGTFLVATNGILKPGGMIQLTMIVLDEIELESRLQVGVNRISFRSE